VCVLVAICRKDGYGKESVMTKKRIKSPGGRQYVLAIRLTEEERDKLRRVSRERFINVSGLARKLLFDNLKDIV